MSLSSIADFIKTSPVQVQGYVATIVGALGLQGAIADDVVVIIMTIITALTGAMATKRVSSGKKTGQAAAGWTK